MLWFNCFIVHHLGNFVSISIHLMLWFNRASDWKAGSHWTFQYILCCGSTIIKKFIFNLRKNFNTSYVVVQRSSPVISVRSTPISIHLMLWFNIEPITPDNINNPISIHLMLWFNLNLLIQTVVVKQFQYILCCGSTQGKGNHFTANYHFNTSYVVVQLE